MQTIGALIGSKDGKRLRPVAELPGVGAIGLELELEGGRFDNVPGWVVHNDGSLRDGVEYVFDGPQGGQEALDTIMAMAAAFKGMDPRPTFRCSTHCHLDVRDLTLAQLNKLVAAYSIMEDVMFDHCDEYRRWSNFCTPYFVTDTLLGVYAKAHQDARGSEGHTIRYLGGFPKYSALNMQPVGRFGSVEFRGSHALTKGEDLLSLAQRMLHLKRVVLESPEDQPLWDFIAVINKMNPLQAFPQGLRQNYHRDQELADSCYSNALKLNQRLLPQKEHKQFSAMAFEDAAAQGGAPLVGMNPHFGGNEPRPRQVIEVRTEGYERFGLMPPPTGSVTEDTAIRVLQALQGIRGIQAPAARDLYHLGRMRHERLQDFLQQLMALNLRA